MKAVLNAAGQWCTPASVFPGKLAKYRIRDSGKWENGRHIAPIVQDFEREPRMASYQLNCRSYHKFEESRLKFAAETHVSNQQFHVIDGNLEYFHFYFQLLDIRSSVERTARFLEQVVRHSSASASKRVTIHMILLVC